MCVRLVLVLFALFLVAIEVDGGCSGCFVANGGSASGDVTECPSDSPCNEADTCSCSSGGMSDGSGGGSGGGSSGGSGGGSGGWMYRSATLRKPDWRQRMLADYHKAHPHHRRLNTCSQSACCETETEKKQREESTTIGIAVGVSVGLIALAGVCFCMLKGSRGGVPVVEGVPLTDISPKKEVR